MDSVTHDLRGFMRIMADILSTKTAGMMTGGLTALWGWVTDVSLVGVVGIIASFATIYYGYCKHKREQALFNEEMRRRRIRK